MTEPVSKLRVDKWLWHARFFKTRSLAARQVSDGHIRVNGARISKPAHSIMEGDVLTFAQGHDVRVVRVAALGVRRGPAAEARTLFEDLSPDPEPPAERAGPRPTKRDRRAFETIRGKVAD